jgi:hypothetical protein
MIRIRNHSIFACLLASLLSVVVHAQVNDTHEAHAGTLQNVTLILESDHKNLFIKNLSLPEDRMEAFSSVYDQYAAELQRVDALRTNLLLAQLTNAEQVSDEAARELIDDILRYEREVSSIRRRYLSRFQRVLSPVELARFYQLESKVNATVTFELARDIMLNLTPLN